MILDGFEERQKALLEEINKEETLKIAINECYKQFKINTGFDTQMLMKCLDMMKKEDKLIYLDTTNLTLFERSYIKHIT